MRSVLKDEDAALDAMDVIALGQQQLGEKAPSWPVTPVIKAVLGMSRGSV